MATGTRWFQTVRLGLKSLLVHKLRSGLTALGIVFGVCSVIAMLAIGEGASYEAQQQIKGLGATNIIVRSIKPAQGASNTSSNNRVLEYGIKHADYERLISTIPTIQKSLPIRELRKEIRNHHYVMDGRVVATTPAYQPMNKLRMYNGRFITQADMDQLENVAVIAYEVAKELFPLENPVGTAVKIENDYFRVVGVCQSRAPSGNIGGSQSGLEYDKDVYIPFTTSDLRHGELQVNTRGGQFSFERTQLSQITLSVATVEEVEPTAKIIRDIMKTSHAQQDYGITVPLELLKQAEETKFLFNVVLGSIGGISLLVGGIGIMNIMLATVTERTREIGVRRALGAKRRDITVQFLAETIVLSSLAGLFGLALGVGLTYFVEMAAAAVGHPIQETWFLFGHDVPFRWVTAAVTGVIFAVAGLAIFANQVKIGVTSPLVIGVGAVAVFFVALVMGAVWGVGLPYLITDLVAHQWGEEKRIPIVVNPWSLPLAFGISVAIGIIFGLYPARRAAMMDPIEALRHE